MNEENVSLKPESLLATFNTRFRKTDLMLAMNKLKVKSIKTLKDGLLTGRKSQEQLIGAYLILMLVREYEQ